MRTHTTTIAIDEVETEVLIHFTATFGEICIRKITDLHTGDAICPDLANDELRAEMLADLKADKRGKYELNY